MKQKQCLPFPPRPIHEECGGSSLHGNSYQTPSLFSTFAQTHYPNRITQSNEDVNQVKKTKDVYQTGSYSSQVPNFLAVQENLTPFNPSPQEELFLPSHLDVNQRD